MTARTTSCFDGRFTLTREILGRRSMRVSDPPPVTMEARRGPRMHTHTKTHTHRCTYTLTPRGRTSTHVRVGSAYAQARTCTCVCDKGNLSLPILSPLTPSLSLFLSFLSVSLSSRTYGTVCHGQKLWQGVQGVQNQGTKSTVLLEMLRWA